MKRLKRLRRSKNGLFWTDGTRKYYQPDITPDQRQYVGEPNQYLVTDDDGRMVTLNKIPSNQTEEVNTYREKDRIGFSSTCSVTLTPGVKAVKVVPFSCDINSWQIVATTSGDIEIDIYTDLATPVSIIGTGTKPALSAAAFSTGTASDWDDYSLLAAQTLLFEIQAGVTISNVVFTMEITANCC